MKSMIQQIWDFKYFPAASIHYLDALKHLPFLTYKYKTSVICYKKPFLPKQPCTITYSWYHLEQNKVNNHCIFGFSPPCPGLPCIVLCKKHFQYIITTKIKNQVLKKLLGRRGDPLPLNQNTKGRQPIIAERLACLKRNKSWKRQHRSNTSSEDKGFPVDDSVMIPIQTKATSADKSEKGNNPEAFSSASSKSSEIGSARSSIKPKVSLNTSPEDEISPMDDSKKNKNLLHLDKSSTKKLASSTF